LIELPFSDLERITLEVADQLFGGGKSITIDEKQYIIQFGVDSRSVTIGDYLFLEQNPRKDTKWAKMARSGQEILWVSKKNQILARVVDGEFTLVSKENP
jgi:hypothetical protein